jgi:hypothetical protein
MSDPNNAIQSLSLIAQAAARLMGDMHYLNATVDRKEELDHIQANLNHVRKLVEEGRK